MQRSKILLLLALVSFLPVLSFYIVGEEGIYTISSMEMWLNDNWMIQTLYAQDLNRPPLMNWLVIPIAHLLGWSHVLVAARLVSITATLGMAAWLYWLCIKLYADKAFALFAALTCLALADLLLYRGWLAYTDPTFSFFTFGAIATLWIASLERHKIWLLVSVGLISCALLSKAFTAYIFYGTTIFVLLLKRETRSYLLKPTALLILSSALIVPYLWFSSLPQTHGHSASMLNEITRKLSVQDLSSYLSHFAQFPIDVLIRLSPALLVAIFLLLRKRVHPDPANVGRLHIAIWIAGLAALPYWLAPQGGIRYLMPIYPVVALISADIIWRSGQAGRDLAMKWFAVVIALKFLFSLILFPYYQTQYRGQNYVIAAQDIMERTRNFPLYAMDDRSIGLCISSYIDQFHYPLAPLTIPPKDFSDGYVLAKDINPDIGQLAESYKVAADEIFLLCKGAACDTGVNIPSHSH